MSKIYTRTGDTGETSLLGGARVRKNDLRIEAIGSIDECNAAVGIVRMELARGGVAPAGLDELLAEVQHRLFDVGAALASPPPALLSPDSLDAEDVKLLEEAIDCHEERLQPLKNFILPGGSPAAAQLHLARCVCRRAERRLVELSETEVVAIELLQYVNRLSDLLFVIARAANAANRTSDVVWKQRPKRARQPPGKE